MRAMLALSSMSIGVMAVVLTSAIGAGAQREVAARIETIGTNLIVVRPATVPRLASRPTIAGAVATLTPDDCDAIAALPFVAAAAPDAERAVRAKAGNSSTRTKVLGTTSSYLQVRNFRLESGRFFDGDDDRHARRVAVLGSGVAAALFDDANPLGREILVRSVIFEVIGVLESKGVAPDGSDEDNQIFVPLKTVLRRVLNKPSLSGIFVSVRDPARIDDARHDISEVLRRRHGREDFGVQNTMKFVAMQKQAAGFLSLLAAALGGIALIVAGSGILALMTMSVKERTSEIGLRMALGATPRDVLLQFLFEATMLTGCGWLAGIAAGGIGAVIVAFATEWKVALPVDALLASAAMVVLCGLGFGVFPARRASRMQPMDALRSV
jgi:ABC-type antimicrobial peptide transport system permease subunit